jgi:uncharacterized protein
VKLEQSFDVEAPLDQVWEALVDVERVAPCLPGAAITGRNEDGTYNGTFTIKIGPTTAAYTGKLEMEAVDEKSHTATMRAQGSDKRGQGGAKATIVSKVTPAGDDQTRVEVDTDYSITGRLARFGRGGMIEDISERLLKEFANRLQSSLSHPGAGGEARDDADQPEPESAAEDAAAEPEAETGAAEPEATDTPEAEAPERANGSAPPTPPPAPPVDEAPALDATSLVGGVLLDRIKRNPFPLVAALLVFLLLRRRRRG